MEFTNSDYWKAIILYGLNASTYKMGFGLGLIEAARQNKNELNWHDNQKFFSTNETRPLLNLRKIELGYPDLSLITNFSQNNKNFPNLEELSIEGVCIDDYLVNPIEISIFKNLKILRMSDSIFQDYKGAGSEEEYYKALDWCNSILIKND